jgi:hypothetical protein
MLTQFAIYTVIASVVGAGYAALSRSRRARTDETPSPKAGFALLESIASWGILLFLFTLPARPPFSSGGTLGWGFLVGAAVGILALALDGGANGAQGLERAMQAVSLACLGPGALLWAFRGDPGTAVMGCALGAVFVAAFGESARDRPEGSSPVQAAEIYALASIALAAAVSLGIEHFPRAAQDSVEGGYWAAPALMLAGGGICLGLLSGGDRERGLWRPLIVGAAGGGFVVAVCAALGSRLLPDLIWTIPLGGLMAFAFLLFLFLQDERPSACETKPLSLALGSIFLILAVLALAFRTSHAYGQALALLPAVVVVAVCVLSRDGFRDSLPEGVATGGLAFALILTLCRLYLERAGNGRELDFQHFYDLFSLFVGGAAGFFVLDFFGGRRAGGGSLLETFFSVATLVAGFATAAAPLSILAILGSRSTGTFLIGLAASEMIWMALACWSGGEDRKRILAAAPHLYLLASALIAIQFAPLIVGLNLTRTHKAILALVMGAIVFIGLATDSARRARALRGGHETSA